MKILSGIGIYFLCVFIGFAQSDSVDQTFDPGAGPGGGGVEVIRVLPDGRILVGGTFTTWNGEARHGLVKLLSDGSLDPTFQFNVSSNISQIFLHGQNLYAGHATLNRLSLDGIRDTNFPPIELDNRSGTVALAGDKIYTTSREPHRYRAVIDRWSLEGQLEGRLITSCCPGESITVAESAPDGSVLFGGLFVPLPGEAPRNLARITPSGLDTVFAPEVAEVRNIARAANGDVYVVHAYGDSTPKLERFTATGILDTNFLAVTDDFTTLLVQEDGRLIYGGSDLKRLNADGTLNSVFTFSFEQGGAVRTLALQSDGRVLAGGGFTTVNGLPRNGIVRLRTDGLKPVPPPLLLGFFVSGRVTDGVNGVAGVRMRLKKLCGIGRSPVCGSTPDAGKSVQPATPSCSCFARYKGRGFSSQASTTSVKPAVRGLAPMAAKLAGFSDQPL